MLGYQFRRKRPMLNYIVDFVCLELMLIKEVDGTTVPYFLLKINLETQAPETWLLLTPVTIDCEDISFWYFKSYFDMRIISSKYGILLNTYWSIGHD